MWRLAPNRGQKFNFREVTFAIITWAKNMRPEEIKDLFEINRWWKEISDELDRVLMIHQLKGVLPDTHKIEAIGALQEHTFISEEKLRSVSSDPVFMEARIILAGLAPDDPFPERLVELYKSKKPEALARLNESALCLISLLSDKPLRENIERVWNSKRYELKLLYLDNAPFPLYVGGVDQRYIIRCLSELACMEDIVRAPGQYPFAGPVYIPAKVENLEAESDQIGEIIEGGQEKPRINYLAYRVCDPLWDKWIERFEPEYVSFPLKWAGSIFTVKQMMRLYKQHKAGGDLIAQILPLYRNHDRLNRLATAIESCPITSSYKELFGEVVDNFQNSRFKVCSISLLPTIEGMLWEFAWWWNRVHGGLFDRPIDRPRYKARTGFELLCPNGGRIGGRPNIGALLRRTKFGEVVDVEFVEFLVEELFDERNPVLHGRNPQYGNEKKATALLLVVEIIERTITEVLKKKLGRDLLDNITNDTITATKL